MRVVLADDHPVVLSGLKALLMPRDGLQVVAVARNGTEALNLLRELEPDIAVLDINMPGLTGLDVLSTLEAEGSSTRIILLTASATDTQISKAVANGAWGLMLKDSAADSLLECIGAVGSGERWLPSELIDPAVQRELERHRNKGGIEFLTPREREIAGLVAQGLSNKHIARRTQISEGTVKIHLHNAYQKLGVTNRTALAALVQSSLPTGTDKG